MIIIGLVATCLRLYARWEQRIFRSDDALIVILLFNLLAYAVLIILAKGFGKNVWDLDPQNVTYSLKVYFSILSKVPDH